MHELGDEQVSHGLYIVAEKRTKRLSQAPNDGYCIEFILES